MLEHKLPINKETFTNIIDILNKLNLEYQLLDIAVNYLKKISCLIFKFFLINGEKYNSRILVTNKDEDSRNKSNLNKPNNLSH